jgi:hypothetical protein
MPGTKAGHPKCNKDQIETQTADSTGAARLTFGPTIAVTRSIDPDFR